MFRLKLHFHTCVFAIDYGLGSRWVLSFIVIGFIVLLDLLVKNSCAENALELFQLLQ
jgi:hypothetical protein